MTWYHYTFPDENVTSSGGVVVNGTHYIRDARVTAITWTTGGGGGNYFLTPASSVLVDPEAQRQAWEEYQRQNQEYLEQRRLANEAEDKARKLFRSKLTKQQLHTLDSDGEIHIRGSKGTIYRINCNYTSENVYSIDLQGKVSYCYCAGPFGLPVGDFLLAQKLLIEADEDAFLKVAIRS